MATNAACRAMLYVLSYISRMPTGGPQMGTVVVRGPASVPSAGCIDIQYLQLDCFSCGRTRIINLVSNQKGYETFETTVGKLSARRI